MTLCLSYSSREQLIGEPILPEGLFRVDNEEEKQTRTFLCLTDSQAILLLQNAEALYIIIRRLVAHRIAT